MTGDIRDKAFLDHTTIVNLNFIRFPGAYVYRRHYRFGLRSHIMEVLRPEDVLREQKGVFIKGMKWFPRATPLKMLRIFRSRFSGLDQALAELERVKIVVNRLAPAHVALSDEFLVSYPSPETHDIILCGLQDYVEGETLDPWGSLDDDVLAALLRGMSLKTSADSDSAKEESLARLKKQAAGFIQKVKKMILEEHHIPDLAGVGNLLITPQGELKLVDINNISRVHFDRVIRLDDRGYPVCDKSIEALSLLEKKFLNRIDEAKDKIYGIFLDRHRRHHVRHMEEIFYHKNALNHSY